MKRKKVTFKIPELLRIIPKKFISSYLGPFEFFFKGVKVFGDPIIMEVYVLFN